RVAGLLAGVLERWDEALAHLDRALRLNERMGALAWVAQTVVDRASVLVARDGAGDRDAAGECITQARALALRLDMRGVAATAEELERRICTRIELRAGAPRQVLRREGDHWTVEYEGRAFHLRDSKGIRLLAYLMRHPGIEFHAAVLVAVAHGSVEGPHVSRGSPQEAERHRPSVTRASHSVRDPVRAAPASLSEHLACTVRTGTVCSYSPDPRVPTTWDS